jgi:hypothetical protein
MIMHTMKSSSTQQRVGSMTGRRTSTILLLLIAVSVFKGSIAQTHLLSKKIMDMTVLGVQVSVLTYNNTDAANFTAQYPIPFTSNTSVSHHGGLYIAGTYRCRHSYNVQLI